MLDPRGGLFGFRDLASARQVSKLFANGIALSEIIRSVKEVRHWLPEADLSNLRLHPAAHHTIEIEQPEGRSDPTFAEAWYNLSDLLDEQGRPEAAIDCLRKALRAAPA